jgi:hypothetical protein
MPAILQCVIDLERALFVCVCVRCAIPQLFADGFDAVSHSQAHTAWCTSAAAAATTAYYHKIKQSMPAVCASQQCTAAVSVLNHASLVVQQKSAATST